MSAQAFWITGPGAGDIRGAVLPDPGPDDVVVRTLFSGVSRGTERLVLQGRVPESQHEVMRAPFQDGDFPAPVKYGYLNVGVVEAGRADLVGRTVFCLYPHQTRYVVPASAVTPLPADLPAERAVLAGTMETAVNALWDAAPVLGDASLVSAIAKELYDRRRTEARDHLLAIETDHPLVLALQLDVRARRGDLEHVAAALRHPHHAPRAVAMRSTRPLLWPRAFRRSCPPTATWTAYLDWLGSTRPSGCPAEPRAVQRPVCRGPATPSARPPLPPAPQSA